MSLDPPAYVVSLHSNIRARPISWDGAVRAKTITDADLKRIKSIDKVRKEQRRQTIDADPQAYVELLLGGSGSQSIFNAASKRPDIVQYMLVLTGDLVEDIPSFVSALVKHPHPYQPFLPLLQREDPIPLLTSCVLSSLISQALVASSKPSTDLEEALVKLYSYLSTLAKNPDNAMQDIAVQHYSAVLRSTTARNLFWKQRKETLGPLVEILRTAAESARPGSSSSIRAASDASLGGGVGLQLLYHVLLVIWQLSFESSSIGEDINEEYDIIPLYVSLLRLSPKEKTTRLLLSTLQQLLSSNSQTLLPVAVLARLPQLLQNLSGKHLNDQDLQEDLKSLTSLLEEYTATQTTFDTYAAEVNSGHLRWSPPHRNATFWRDNARRIVDDSNGALVRKLSEILSKDWQQDKQVLAIGCNDVACLVREVPEKRPYLEKLGLKGRVMALMAESDEGVRWEALRATGEWLRYSFEG